ncbi:shikimate dehydrogenase [Halocatena marina]|uniref:shikimate dehydrogenase family protein n=1 Tax=Halocatena marina TaxID=2934937 RepID=UPI0034A2E2DA
MHQASLRSRGLSRKFESARKERTNELFASPAKWSLIDVYGIIGDPVEHSLSPPMHQAAFDELGIDSVFVTFEANPNRIGQAFHGAEALGFDGLTVTLPFKHDVLKYVDSDKRTELVGAVNTINFNESLPVGYNFDLSRTLRAFENHDVALTGADTIVIGAGGTVRAIAFGFESRGANVAIANRTVERADNQETATSTLSCRRRMYVQTARNQLLSQLRRTRRPCLSCR